MKDRSALMALGSKTDKGFAGTQDDLTSGLDLSGILVIDPKTLTGDLDPLASLTEGMVEMWEDILLYRPEASGPPN